MPATLSSGTISFHSDPTNAMHQALYSSMGTVASTLAFADTKDSSYKLTYSGSAAIAVSGSRETR